MRAHLDSPILVTGASGFIGSHLVEALLERGYRVRCQVRSTSRLDHLQGLPVEWVRADLCDADSVREACRDIQAICHCAALTRALDEATFLQVNAGGTETLAQACLDAAPALRRFLFVSSLAAAGPARRLDEPLLESSPPQPITWYGRSKLAAENVLLGLADRIPVTIVRPGPVFGPRDGDFFAYFQLIDRGLSLHIGRADRWLSLIYVRNLVDLLLRALESEASIGQVYFGTDTACTRDDFAAAIARALGRRPVRVNLPEAILAPISLGSRLQGRLTRRPALLNDQRVLDMRERFWICSSEKAQRELEFTPRVGLDEAARETAAWYRQQRWLRSA